LRIAVAKEDTWHLLIYLSR